MTLGARVPRTAWRLTWPHIVCRSRDFSSAIARAPRRGWVSIALENRSVVGLAMVSPGSFLSLSPGVTVSGVIEENIGLKNQITFDNASAASAVVTATVTGYSTQVTAGDVHGSGGAPGQVLTDTASGPSWQSAGGTTYDQIMTTGFALIPSLRTVASLTVVPASYQLTYSAELFNGNASSKDPIQCVFYAPSGTAGPGWHMFVPPVSGGEIVMQAAMNAPSGGTITVQCENGDGSGIFGATARSV